jgi:RNA polymerase sigma-70 factor (ECF subfamily)
LTEKPEDRLDLRKCLAGDSRAWDGFCQRYTPLVYSVVRRILCRGHSGRANVAREDIEEIVQEVFLRLVKDDSRLLRSFDPGKGKTSTWLSRIAESTARNALRKPVIATIPLEEAGETPSKPSLSRQALPIPEGILSPREKETLDLLFVEGLTVQEAAERIGTAPQTVSGHKYRAINKLRVYLASRPEE